MNRFAILICLLSFATTSFSQPDYFPPGFKNNASRKEKVLATKAVVDSLFMAHAKRNNLPALVYAIVLDGNMIYSGGRGYADVQKKIPADNNTAFRIASMTKSFTSLAILKLRDEGRLQLDDAASRYIPEMAKLDYLTTDAPPITIRHLMNHMAGFPEDNPWGDRQLADSDQDLLDLVSHDLSFSNVPGIAYEYSNTGYALLGRIITNVSGKPYDVYINEEILEPLGMNYTWWDYRNVPAAKLAHGYRWQDGKWQEEALLAHGSYGAMGGLITTIHDFVKYMRLHMQAWPARTGNESDVLSRSSLREMHSSGVFSSMNPNFRYPSGRVCATTNMYSYGLGWTRDCEGKTWVGHSGGLPGFGSNWRFYPEYGIGVVCFANRTYAPMAAINTAVMDTIIRMAGLQAYEFEASAILLERQEQLTELLPAFDKNMEIFAENFFPDHPLEIVKKEAEEIFKKAGKIIRIGEMKAQNRLRGSFIMEGEKANVHVFFTLSPEKEAKVQQLDIRLINK